MTPHPRTADSHPSILSFAKDLPNICSLTGLLCTMLAIYFAIIGNFSAAMIGLIWAVLFDWTDGIIARNQKGRNATQGKFGAQLDLLIDIVSFGICPAIVLLSYGEFNPWFFPGAFLGVAAGVLRLSYYNVFGLIDQSSYRGLAIDNNGILLTFIFLFNGQVEQTIFSYVLYGFMVILSCLNVSPIKTPKFSGRWFYALILYTVVITVVYGWRLLPA